MKTLLVLAAHPELAEEIRAALDSTEYRVVHRSTLEQAEPGRSRVSRCLHFGCGSHECAGDMVD
jgi:hypothetical protein